ncbi:MAG: iron-sulfur cluster assembly accessory protein [Gammaproteobacteria bacterium]|nr:iron-sulfur cluster assembly accessory protein [Gammaproteobacteria bacterium]
MSISITESAAAHVKNMLKAEQDARGLRLGITKSGCSGYQYVMDFAREIGDKDRVFESHGVKLIVDADSLSALEGVELDFVREGLNSMFKFNNPNAVNECGCGESFAIQ